MRLSTLYESAEYIEQIRSILVGKGVPDHDIKQLIVQSAIAINMDEGNGVPPEYPANALYRRWEQQAEVQRTRDARRDIEYNNKLVGDIGSGKRILGGLKPPGPGDVDELNRIIDSMP